MTLDTMVNYGMTHVVGDKNSIKIYQVGAVYVRKACHKLFICWNQQDLLEVVNIYQSINPKLKVYICVAVIHIWLIYVFN